ncbi:hypothetical protein ES703_39641 [subsurface metagenome]
MRGWLCGSPVQEKGEVDQDTRGATEEVKKAQEEVRGGKMRWWSNSGSECSRSGELDTRSGRCAGGRRCSEIKILKTGADIYIGSRNGGS